MDNDQLYKLEFPYSSLTYNEKITQFCLVSRRNVQSHSLPLSTLKTCCCPNKGHV
jgi:hypothetical protein